MATVNVDVEAKTWKVLPTADYFTGQNTSNFRLFLKASATEPADHVGAHWVEPGKTFGSLDDLAHYVYCNEPVTISFTADNR